MTWTMCASAAAISNAGVHANSAIIASAATLLNWCTEEEGFICMETHYDWIANYTGLNARIKGALSKACGAAIGMRIVDYNITGYLTREADTKMNFLTDVYGQCLKFLSIKQNQTLN